MKLKAVILTFLMINAYSGSITAMQAEDWRNAMLWALLVAFYAVVLKYYPMEHSKVEKDKSSKRQMK